MTVLIDTHAHLDFPQYSKDLEQVLERAYSKGVRAILNAGTDEKSTERSIRLSEKNPKISASAGIHPHGAARTGSGWIQRLEKLALKETVLAIGETGLDFYRDLSPRDVQEDVFREQIRLARRVNKPLIIHTREAHQATLKILKEEELPSPAGVMHCFSGSREQVERYLDLGFYISFAGPLTYPRSHELREALKAVPSNRLLLETDAPYLPPQAYRSKRNEPAYISLIYERAALELGISLVVLAEQVYLNALRLFSDLLVDRI